MARRKQPIETPAQQQAREIKEMMDNWAVPAPMTPAPSLPAPTTTAPIDPAPAAQPFRLLDLAKEIQLLVCKAALLDRGEIDIMDDSRDYLNLMRTNKKMCATAKDAEKKLLGDPKLNPAEEENKLKLIGEHKLFRATCHSAQDAFKAATRAQALFTPERRKAGCRIRVVFTAKNPMLHGLKWFMQLEKEQRRRKGKFFGGPRRKQYPQDPLERERLILGQREAFFAREDNRAVAVEYAREPAEEKKGGRPVSKMLEVLEKGPAWWPEDADFDVAVSCAQHSDGAEYLGRTDFKMVWY